MKSSSDKNYREKSAPSMPLAAMMRPKKLVDFIGQSHLIGENKILRRAIEMDRFTSLIFYGRAGVGKTSLAEIIAYTTNYRFVSLSAVTSNVSDLRNEIKKAQDFEQIGNEKTVIFIDEIHRFNKSQQDVLLPFIEQGAIKFIGATTHNPYFYLNSPLISRSQVFELEPLSEQNLRDLVTKALSDKLRGLPAYDYNVKISKEAIEHLVKYSDGDARKCLNVLELAVITSRKIEGEKISIDLDSIQEAMQKKSVNYDADGDEHYDTISAFIKSLRGSDPDAALYWLAKMIYAGEDPRFIVRRLIIFASEDVGLADSNALRLCTSALQAVDFIGMPEARITLAHATSYLATAPKSNSAYMGLESALNDVKTNKTLEVPLHLRTKTRKKLSKSTNASDKDLEYKYPHDFKDSVVEQNYLPEDFLKDQKKKYFYPTENGQEKRIKERLDYWKKIK